MQNEFIAPEAKQNNCQLNHVDAPTTWLRAFRLPLRGIWSEHARDEILGIRRQGKPDLILVALPEEIESAHLWVRGRRKHAQSSGVG